MARELAVVNTYQVSDALINSFLDEGYFTLLTRRDWPFAIGEEVVTAVPGQSTYDLDPSATKVMNVLDQEDDTYLRSTTAERIEVMLNSTVATTTPLVFYFNPGSDATTPVAPFLKLFPIPADTRTWQVVYRTLPIFGAGDDDTPPFNAAFHSCLVDWATYRIWEKEEDLDRSDASRARYETRVNELIEFYNVTTEDRPMIYGQSKTAVFPTNMPFLNDAAQGGAS